MRTFFNQHKSLLIILLLISFISVVISCNNLSSKNKNYILIQKDSIAQWLENSESKSFDPIQRKEFLLKAYKKNDEQILDSIKNINLLKIAYRAYKLNDSIFFEKLIKETIDLSNLMQDTLRIGIAHSYYGNYYANKEKVDSALYHYNFASQKFQSINNNYKNGRMLYNMAVLEKNVRDYTGSEILTFNAISKFQNINKPLNLFWCYNLLGVVFTEIKEYDKAIHYHEKAVEYLKKIKNKGTLREISLNNIGMIYHKQGKYDKAISIFKEGLKNKELKHLDIDNYTRLIDNLAYSKFLKGDTTDVLKDLYKSLKIRDSINYESGIIISKIHLSEFHAKFKDTIKAINLAKEAHVLAKEVNNNRDILASLLLLSDLDKFNAIEYLKEYVTLSDKLQIEEKQLRNKFTRIRFETNEYIEETEKLDAQNKLIFFGSIILILIITLLYLLKVQRSKNKGLIFEKEQQKATEEIYALMLRQQSIIEEGKFKERQRISEDLHDGILSRIFGTRMGLGFLSVKGDKKTMIKHKNFIDELQGIEKEIRDISHELKNELFSDQLNFEVLVEDLLKTQSKIGDFKYKFTRDSNILWNEVPENIKINCYRIIQETIQNTNKHAKASKLHLKFKRTNKMIELSIKDNGIGFNLNEKRNGIGLKNIKFRAQSIGAEFKLHSKINEGTFLILFIPL